MKISENKLSAAVLVLAVLTAIGVKTLFGPCIHDDGSVGSCYQAGQAVFGTALVLAGEGFLCLFIKEEKVRAGLQLAMTCTAVLGMIFPGILIRLCGMSTMRCRALMRPAVTILFAIAGILALAGAVRTLIRNR